MNNSNRIKVKVMFLVSLLLVISIALAWKYHAQNDVICYDLVNKSKTRLENATDNGRPFLLSSAANQSFRQKNHGHCTSRENPKYPVVFYL